MGHTLQQRCPDGRVGVEASRGCSLPCVYSLKKGPLNFFWGQKSLQRPSKNGGHRPDSDGDFIDSEKTISSWGPLCDTRWRPFARQPGLRWSISMAQLTECGNLLMPNDALKVQ